MNEGTLGGIAVSAAPEGMKDMEGIVGPGIEPMRLSIRSRSGTFLAKRKTYLRVHSDKRVFGQMRR
jgi:hypothetical protein